MKTTKEQRAELRARTPTSQQSMYQLYVRRAELHAVLDDLDEAEARAERLREALVRANNVLSDIGDSDGPTRDGESMSLALAETWAANALPMIRAALAETSPKTSERDGREGDPAETPQEPGTSSRGIPRTDDDGERRGNIHPAQAPDDVERAAVEAWMKVLTKEQARASIHARDAQAREAGRVEAIEDVVAGFKAKVKAGYDVPPYVFAELRNALDYLKRPDRAKGGAT